ncbi:uncharacterized [Tachysurus ichikawai]
MVHSNRMSPGISKSTPLPMSVNWRRTRERMCRERKEQALKKRRNRQTTGRRGELLLGYTVGRASRRVDEEQPHPAGRLQHTCTCVRAASRHEPCEAARTEPSLHWRELLLLYITIITTFLSATDLHQHCVALIMAVFLSFMVSFSCHLE